MKKLEDFAKKILSEADEPWDPDKTGAGKVYSIEQDPKHQASVAAEAESKALIRGRENIDKAVAVLSGIIKKEIPYFGEVFSILEGKPNAIPHNWQSMMAKNGLGRWGTGSLLGKFAYVGFCNPKAASGKIPFVAAQGSSFGVNTDFFGSPSIGSVPERTDAPINPQTNQVSQAFAELDDKGFRTSEYNEENIAQGVKLLNYALERVRELFEQSASGKLPERVQSSTVLSVMAPLFCPLVAYAYKNKISPKDGVTAQQYVNFMRTANPGSATLLGDKKRTLSLASLVGDAIASYIVNGDVERGTGVKYGKALRLFRPMVRFSNVGTHENEQEDVHKITILLQGQESQSGGGLGLYINFPFPNSIFHIILEKFAKKGAERAKKVVDFGYSRRETPKEYIRRVMPFALEGMKSFGLGVGVGGRVGSQEAAQKQIDQRLQAEKPAVVTNAKTGVMQTPEQGEQNSQIEPGEFLGAEAQAYSILLNLLLRRAIYTPVRKIGFQNFTGSLLDLGNSAFLEESKQKRTVRTVLMEKQNKKNKLV